MKGFNRNKYILVFFGLLTSMVASAQTDFEVRLLNQQPVQFPVGSSSETLTFEVENFGPLDEADQTTVTFTINPLLDPLNMASAISPDDQNWDCVQSTGQVICDYFNIYTVSTITTLELTVPIPLIPTSISNAVSVSFSNALGDINPGNSNYQIDVAVGGFPEVEVIKSIVGGNSQAVPGSMIDYEILVNNIGAINATNVDLTDTLPIGVTYQNHTELGPNFSCTYAAPILSCLAPTLPVTTGTDGVVITVLVDGAINLAVTNTAISAYLDGNSLNNVGTALFNIIGGSADLDLSIVSDFSSYTEGDLVGLDLTLHNPVVSTGTPTNNTVVTTLPPELVYSSANVTNAAGWLCSHDGATSGGDVTCNSQGNPVPIGTNIFIHISAIANVAGTALNTVATVTSDFDPNPSNDTANVIFDIFPGDADLSLVFTSTSGVYNQGDPIAYGIQVNNPMTSTANPADVGVVIGLPAEVSYTNADLSSAPGWFCSHDGSPTGGTVTCDRAGAPFVSFSTHDIIINVLAVLPAASAIVSGDIFTTADSFTSNNSDSQVDVINAGTADFNIAKTVSGTTFAINDTFTYFLTVSNPVASTATPIDVVINDQLPVEVSYDSYIVSTNLGTTINCVHDGSTTGGLFSCDTSGAAFAIGEVVTIDVNVTAAAANPTTNNTATVETAIDLDGTGGNNTASVMVDISGSLVTTLAATKIASVAGVPVSQVDYGQTFEYELMVENTGTNDALNVNITDFLPADVILTNTISSGWTCGLGKVRGGGDFVDCTYDSVLTPGGTAQVVVEVVATTNTTVTSILNQMQVVGTNTGPPVDANVTVSLLSPMMNLTLSQIPSPVDPGADVDFAVVINNTGTTPLTGVNVSNIIPNGFTYNGFTATPGLSCIEITGSVDCSLTAPLAASSNVSFNLETTAVATPVSGQTYILSSTGNANEIVAPITENLTVAFSTSDVMVSMISVPTQAALGEPFKQLINIQNSGTFALVNINSIYAIPQAATLLGVSSNDFSCSSDATFVVCNNLQPLMVGASANIEIELRVDDVVGLLGGNVVVNADGINRTANVTTQITSNARNDFMIIKSTSVDEIGMNETFSYIFDVTNIGSEPQTLFLVTDDLPPGIVYQASSGLNWNCIGDTELSCQYSGSLASGTQTQLVVDVIAPNETGQVSNTATVTLLGDENPNNDSSTATIQVGEGTGGGGLARADLAVELEVSSANVVNTEQVSWKIKVTNEGPDTANNVIITDIFPIGFIAENVQVGNDVECTLLEASLMCEIDSLVFNQSHEIIVEGSFNSGFDGVLINIVEVESDAIDDNPANNEATEQVTVTAVENLEADLSLELDASSQDVQQGDVFDLSFKTNNLGPDRAVNAKVTASISGLIDSVQVLNPGSWVCQTNNAGLNCTYPGDLMVGMMSVIDIRVQTSQVVQQSQPILFNAVIESDSMDNNPGNNMVGFSNDVSRTPTEDEIFELFQTAVGSAASETVIQSIRNVSSYCARSYFMAIEGLCEEMIASARPENGSAIIHAMEELTPNEVAAQSNSAAEIITSQFRNVSSRLSQIRGGGGAGVNVSGLTGRYGNESIPIGMLAYLNDSDEDQAASNINDFVSPWGFFVNGSVSMGERDATGKELGFDFDTYGLTAGVDYRFSPTKVAGVALGYANFDSEIEGEAEMKSTGFTLTGYGSFYIKDNFYVDGRISYGNPDFKQKRRINFDLDNISIDRVATGSTNSDQYSVAMSMGYHFNKNSWNITPNASVQYVRTTIDAFQESGAGGFNFAFGEQEVKSMVWSVGTSVSKAISLKNGVISPQFDINISRETENDGGLLEARFISAPDDEIFWIGTDEPDRTYGSAGVGLVFIGANGKQAYINYRSIFGLEGFTRGTINIGARFEF